MTKDAKQEASEPKIKNVYQAIAAVQAELAKAGIAKDRDNQQQKYKFRGIDDIYNALSSRLAEHGLCILPRFSHPERSERKSNSGGAIFCVTISGEFDFVSAADGSKHTVTVYGEAMDSGDKATNKAMSAAYKYACLQTFCIPTEGDNDPDSTTHAVASNDVLFATPQERKKFHDDCMKAIDEAKSKEALKAVRVGNLAKWNAMAESKDAGDSSTWELIKTAYNQKFGSFKEAVKPVTVDSVVSNGQVLADDHIPF